MIMGNTPVRDVPMRDALITVDDVSLGYDTGYALEHVSFDIKQGDYISIVGTNGSGKTSLLKVILGLKTPTSGRVTYNGIARDEIGYMPQQTDFQKDFPASCQEIVLSGLAARRFLRVGYSFEEKKICRDNMARLGIEDLIRRPYGELSGGQQQRVLLARALCASGRLLLLDEPLTGLDPVMSQEFYAILAALCKEGTAIVMVSHDIRGAVDYSGKILHLDTNMRFFGTAHEYKHSDVGVYFLGRCNECPL